jgi:hypothetical protein
MRGFVIRRDAMYLQRAAIMGAAREIQPVILRNEGSLAGHLGGTRRDPSFLRMTVKNEEQPRG